MKLPNGNRAIIPDEKLALYVLNPFHREGKRHAELFARLLGLDASRASTLRYALADAAENGEAILGKASSYGQKYEIRFQMTGLKKSYTILSVWMIRMREDVPRRVTAYVEKMQ